MAVLLVYLLVDKMVVEKVECLVGQMVAVSALSLDVPMVDLRAVHLENMKAVLTVYWWVDSKDS